MSEHHRGSPQGPCGGMRWTDAEKGFLRQMYQQMPTAEIANCLGRSVKAIHGYAVVLGVDRSSVSEKRTRKLVGMKNFRGRRKWSDTDLDLLRRRYPNEGANPLMKPLGRSANAIIMKANLLGLKKVGAKEYAV